MDQIESQNGVVTAARFESSLRAFELLLLCCETLAPVARKYINRFGSSNEERAIQHSANEGNFLNGDVRSPFVDFLKDEGVLPEFFVRLPKTIRKSWFSYHAKRRAKETNGEYQITDEELVAMAAANSFLLGRSTVVLSNDKDLAVIVKNLRDNVLWVYSKCAALSGAIKPEDLISTFDEFSRMAVSFEQTAATVPTLDLTSNQMMVFWERSNILNHYHFPPFFLEFVRSEMLLGAPVQLLQELVAL